MIRRKKIPSSAYRTGNKTSTLTPSQIKKRDAYIEMYKQFDAEIAAIPVPDDLPSDYNDPEQMMIYEEIDYLLEALETGNPKPFLPPITNLILSKK